jgi:hypothetical protein
MAELITEKLSINEFNKKLLVEERKHDYYQNEELNIVFSLIAAIENHMYNEKPKIIQNWYVGITDDVAKRKAAHADKYPEHFKSWDCESDRISRLAEVYLTTYRGVKGDIGGGTSCRFIYCFLIGKKPAEPTKEKTTPPITKK